MGVDEKEREQAILDAAVELILRHGYNKTTMSDVADAVGLHRGLVYLHFKSKDELLEALIVREMSTYAEAWSRHLEADPLGGTMASVHRNMLHTLKSFPLMAAIVTRDEEIFGKYLRKPDNLLTRLPSSPTLEFLQTMQKVGAVRQGVNVAAMAFILDTLTPAILETLASYVGELRGDSRRSNRPSFDELMETIAEMLERMLTPAEGANLAAGKAIMRQGLYQAQARFTETMALQKKENT